MRFSRSLIPSILLLGAPIAAAASSAWSFDEAIISVTARGSGVGSGLKDKYVLLHFTLDCTDSVGRLGRTRAVQEWLEFGLGLGKTKSCIMEKG